MSGEQESLEFMSGEQVDQILRHWVTVAAATANATEGDQTDYEKGFHAGVKRMRWLYLAEPWLITAKIFDALKLAGWTPPAGSIAVSYKEND